MRICENCGQEAQGNTKFCRSCGHQLGTPGSYQFSQTSQSNQTVVCSNCGAKLTPNMQFCEVCGMAIDGGYNHTTYGPEQGGGYGNDTMHYDPSVYVEKKSNKGVVAALSVLLAVIIVAVSVVGFMVFQDQSDNPDDPVETVESGDQSEVEVSENGEEVKVVNKQERVEGAIEAYLQSSGISSSASVAVYNNQNGETYSSAESTASYTAWGLYIPIYLVYGECNGYDAQIRNKILSSDPATCNASANSAMTHIGGLERVNGLLYDFYGTGSTSYGRWFGQTSNSAANSTTAKDSIVFLQKMNESGAYSMMNYNMGSFGISGPSGANVYAHVGTENRSVRKELNLFAIVKGTNSDYCVAILTKDYKGGYITGLLGAIHTEMEQ